MSIILPGEREGEPTLSLCSVILTVKKHGEQMAASGRGDFRG